MFNADLEQMKPSNIIKYVISGVVLYMLAIWFFSKLFAYLLLA